MVQAVSRTPLAIETRNWFHANLYESFGLQSSIWADFYLNTSFYPASIIMPTLHTHISFILLTLYNLINWQHL